VVKCKIHTIPILMHQVGISTNCMFDMIYSKIALTYMYRIQSHAIIGSFLLQTESGVEDPTEQSL
jgi:hypothetical protein